jgi:hypothetical protein
MVLDSTAAPPFLSPMLLERIRSAVAVRPRAVRDILFMVHLITVTLIILATGECVRKKVVPESFGRVRLLLGANFFVKLLVVQLTYSKSRIQRKRTLNMRQLGIIFVAFSDMLIFLGFAGLALWEIHFGHQEYCELQAEQAVLTFTYLSVVNLNTVVIGLMTYRAMSSGASFLKSRNWNEGLSRTRELATFFAGAAAMWSLMLHGVSPSFFTLLCVFNGLGIGKLLLWSSVEIVRTLYEIARRFESNLKTSGVVLGLLCVLCLWSPASLSIALGFAASVYW